MAAAVAAPSPFLGGHTRVHARKSSLKRYIMNSVTGFRIKALFWGSRNATEPTKLDLSLGDFSLTHLGSEGDDAKDNMLSVSVVSSISEISSDEWNTCSLDAAGPEQFNPFLSHGFLSSLEESGCAVKEKILRSSRGKRKNSRHHHLYNLHLDAFVLLVVGHITDIVIDCTTIQETGWVPQHIVARDGCNVVLGVIPLYLKSHSYGEYVFDHSWADAYHSYGSRYYPKLQCCVPFTPVTGPRILVRNTKYREQVFDNLVSALLELTVKYQVSSLHITFPSANEWVKLKEKGFLQRIGMQYHWKNRNYKSFDDFLMDMKQNKRKNIRQERKKISAQNLTMKRLRGYEIKAKHWDTFYKFYRNTTDNKWGSAYLTRDFFHNLASKMGDDVLLIAAEEGDELIAGALNLIGGDTLYGRLWGCLPRAYYPNLHFEACYYQAIEAAIELNLNTVEAGAQGEHKIQRGYLPVTTYSLHYIRDEDFRKVISNFLVRESAQLEHVMKLLNDSGPFKDNVS